MVDTSLNDNNEFNVTVQKQKNGYIFESKIYEMLCKLNLFNTILSEKEIVSKFGHNLYGIDHIAIRDNFIITLQEKWESSSPNIERIHQFINCSELIKEQISNKTILLCAIFVSKIKMTNNGINIINKTGNSKYTEDIYFDMSLDKYVTNNENLNMNNLVLKVENKIRKCMKQKGFCLVRNKMKDGLRMDQKEDVKKFTDNFLNV